MPAGHPPNIKDEAHMIKLWASYKTDLKEKAKEWERIQYVGAVGSKKTDNPKLPLTFEGFKRFCFDTGVGTIEQYFVNQDGLYDKYISICSRIKNEIREDQITGGILGMYNSSITQRLNGLVDKKQIETKAEPRVFNLPPEDDDKKK
jgi:hypothetical protein